MMIPDKINAENIFKVAGNWVIGWVAGWRGIYCLYATKALKGLGEGGGDYSTPSYPFKRRACVH